MMNIIESSRILEINARIRNVNQICLSIGPQYRLWWWESDGKFSMFYGTLDYAHDNTHKSVLIHEFVRRVGRGKIVHGPLKVASTDRMVASLIFDSKSDDSIIQSVQIAAGMKIYCLSLFKRSGIEIVEIRLNDPQFAPESDYFLPLSFTGRT